MSTFLPWRLLLLATLAFACTPGGASVSDEAPDTGTGDSGTAAQRRPEVKPIALRTTEPRLSAPGEAKYDAQAPLRDWPPVVGRPYPEFSLIDQTGRVTSLSELRGRVVLLEMVGMTCSACNAFAGGNDSSRGGFRGISPQQDLGSIAGYAQQYGKTSLDHPDVVFVQLVVYGMDGRSPPSASNIEAWARHFDMNRSRDEIVLAGDARFISPETRRLIPGFHLLDRQGVLRAAQSNDPRSDNLFTSLLPSMGSLVKTR